MSPVELKERSMSCRYYFFRMLISSMLHVAFNKWPCRPVEFEGPEPRWWGADRSGRPSVGVTGEGVTGRVLPPG